MITSYSDIKPRENISPPLMDTTFVLEIGKFLLFGVGGLISIGIVWDLLNLLNKLLRKQVKQKNTGKREDISSKCYSCHYLIQGSIP